MQVFIHSKTLEITAALRSFIERQARKLTHRGRQIEAVNVFVETVRRKKNDLKATVAKMQIVVPGKNIIVEKRAADLYQAVLDVSASAARQVRRTREKRFANRRHAELDWQLSPI